MGAHRERLLGLGRRPLEVLSRPADEVRGRTDAAAVAVITLCVAGLPTAAFRRALTARAPPGRSHHPESGPMGWADQNTGPDGWDEAVALDQPLQFGEDAEDEGLPPRSHRPPSGRSRARVEAGGPFRDEAGPRSLRYGHISVDLPIVTFVSWPVTAVKTHPWM